MKLHQPAQAIQELRQASDNLCMEYGLSICQPNPDRQRVKGMSSAEYHAAAKGESWKMQLINTIDEAMRYATSKSRFIEMMESEGYKVKWTDTRKSITYTTPNGNPCRDDRLHEMKYLKERMEHEFRIRQEIIAGGIKKQEQTTASEDTTATVSAVSMSDDAAGCGRDIRYSDNLTGTDESDSTAELQPQNAAKQSADTDGAGPNQSNPIADTADALTGWETEREMLFHPEMALAEDISQPDVAASAPDIGGVVGSVVQLGKAVEHLGNNVPVKDATTKPQHSGKKKKLAVGQKEDDHSGYDFTMTM